MIPLPRVSQQVTGLQLNWTCSLQWVKSTIKSNIELDMTNCDVSVMSYLNFVTDKIKIEPFSVLVRIYFSLTDMNIRTVTIVFSIHVPSIHTTKSSSDGGICVLFTQFCHITSLVS